MKLSAPVSYTHLTAICQGLNPLGKTNWTPVNVPWAPNGAQIHINANPKLPGAYNFYNLYLSKEQQDLLFDPLQCTTVPFDGIYLDELSGWWNGNANFNKAHYQYTTVPLTCLLYTSNSRGDPPAAGDRRGCF